MPATPPRSARARSAASSLLRGLSKTARHPVCEIRIGFAEASIASAVARMNALGIAVDVSHSGQRTTAEAIEASAKPILISHTGCRAVFDNPRNKDDAALRALAERVH